jgi:short-subunit dehydrogenase
MADFLSSLKEQVDWDGIRPWLLPAAGTVLAAYLVYKAVRILRTDCDLTLMCKRLKAGYFNGKVVWVTGASSGIGEALCYELSQHGALLIMSARSEEKMETIRQNLKFPANAKILPLDLCDAAVCASATEKAMELFGRVDILINNAGVSQRCFFMDTDDKTHSDMMQLNFNAPRTLIQGLIPGMLSRNFGHIVNISSICGKSGFPLRSTYCSTKFALHGLTESLKWEFHDKKNLHFTIICPGPVRTQVDRNSLMGGGKIYGEMDSINQTGMTAERCAKLTLVSVSNQLFESWVSPKPGLCVPYMAHYSQWLLHVVWRIRAGRFIHDTHGRTGY